MVITANTVVEELLSTHPRFSRVFIECGAPCFVCGEAFWGTVHDLAHQYNIDVDTLVRKLNERKQSIDEEV